MSTRTIDDLGDAIDAESAAIATARVELATPPACAPGCRCQCAKSHCGCHDEERLTWRAREAESFEVPMSAEVADACV